MADFTLTSFSPSSSGNFALLEEEVTTVFSEPVAFVEDEAWSEPDITIYVDGTAADFIEDESVAVDASLAAIVVTSEPVAFIEDESAGVSQTVRAFSAAAFAEDETAGVAQVVRAFSDAAFTEDEAAQADVGTVTVFSAAAFVEDEELAADGFAVPPAGVVNGELHAVEDESLSVTATVRVYSEAVAFLEDESLAVLASGDGPVVVTSEPVAFLEGESLAATAQVTVYSSAAFVEDESLDASVRPVFNVHPSNILRIQRASPRILTR